MNKFFKVSMLAMLIGAQFSGVIANITYYASEVATETVSEEINEVSSDTVKSETESEVSSDQQSEESFVESEVSSADSDISEASNVEAEVSNSDISEVETESTTKTQSDVEDTSTVTSEADVQESELTAKIEIVNNGALKDSVKAIPSSFLDDSQLEEDENLTTYENNLRLDANSGESTISITPTKKSSKSGSDIENQEVYYTLNEDGEITSGNTKEPRSYEGNLITVYDGKIVAADNAIARTSGGYDSTFYVYSSISDLKTNTDPVPLSGGGFDATYIETVEKDGIYYDHIKISGFDGYTEAGNIQIIPVELLQARSYYVAEDGNWVYYSAIDPLTSDEYDVMTIGAAPSAAEVGTKYYSDDDENYYTEQLITTSTTASVSYNSYFQNLPFRSESKYSASDFKNYLKAKGKTNSEYYSETSAFTQAQSKENINALMIFAMANHESAYGTSTYARACYNFFGRGAIDSDPDKACESYSYNTATDGILAQTLFLQNGYFDVLDWRYSGTHVGNKASGMNVKYASDTDWGKKISNHAYMMDQYMGGKEENKYAIAKVSGVSHVYTNANLSTKVKSSGDSGKYSFYDLSQMAGTSNTVNVVALQQDSDAYQIYVPTAVKDDSSVDCSYTNSMRGSYPNYGGRSKVSVDTNTANYSCDYVSFSNNKYWIKKSGTSIINDKSVPYTTKNYYTYYSNGKVNMKYYVNASTNVIQYAHKYDEKGNLIKKYVYHDGTKYGSNNEDHVYKVYYLNDGKLTSIRKYNEKRQLIYVYAMYDGATLSNYSTKIKYRFNLNASNRVIKSTYQYPKGSTKREAILTYASGTQYEDRANALRYKYVVKPGTSKMTKSYVFDSKGRNTMVYTYQDGTEFGDHGSKYLKDVFWLKGSKKEIDYSITYKKGKRYVKYLYDTGTVLGKNHGDHIRKKYYF